MSPVRYCGGTPHCTVQNQVFCRTGRPRRTVRYRKRPCGVRELILAPGPHGLKKVLQECVDAGDKSKPLTDEWLIIEMGKHGYEVARRTIAKYRGRLGIPLARWRKEL